MIDYLPVSTDVAVYYFGAIISTATAGFVFIFQPLDDITAANLMIGAMLTLVAIQDLHNAHLQKQLEQEREHNDGN